MKKWWNIGFCAILIVALISGCIQPRSSTEQSVATPASKTMEVTGTPLPVATTIPETAGTLVKTTTPIVAQKTILFSDNLSQYRSDWDTGYSDKRKNLSSYYTGGSLHIRTGLISKNSSSTNHKLFRNFNDFILDVDTKYIDGSTENWQGAEVRVKDDNNHYFLAISSNGSYMVSKTENKFETFLNKPTFSGYINSGIGGTNNIRIEADKNALSLFVNGHHLTTVYDDTFIGGMVDLRVMCTDPNPFTEVAFSNLIITTV